MRSPCPPVRRGKRANRGCCACIASSWRPWRNLGLAGMIALVARCRSSMATFCAFSNTPSATCCARGKKIVGSAQRKYRQALMQHGSILLAQSEHTPRIARHPRTDWRHACACCGMRSDRVRPLPRQRVGASRHWIGPKRRSGSIVQVGRGEICDFGVEREAVKKPPPRAGGLAAAGAGFSGVALA